LATTITDGNGNYLFEGLAAGSYTVKVNAATLPPYVVATPSYDPQGGADGSALVAIGPANPHPRNIDFSYPPEVDGVGRIGNLVWEDLNADGVYQPDGTDGLPGTADDEKPIGGVTVDLYRDLNGNGKVDPGEPLVGSAVTASAISAAYGPNGN
jgi:hypothetical protein